MHGRGLWLLAARYAEFAGWMAHENGNVADASRWTLAAAQWAARGGDAEMAGYRWERNALTTLYRCDGPETVALAQRAAAHRGPSTRVLALALRREAQGHALAGDATRFHRALEASERLAADAPAPYPHGDSWGPNSIEDSSRVIEASGLVDLGLHRAAVRLFGPDPGSAIPAPAMRTRVRFAVRGALAHAERCRGARVQPDGARTGHAGRLESATIRTDLERLAAVLNRHRAAPEVVALLPICTRSSERRVASCGSQLPGNVSQRLCRRRPYSPEVGVDCAPPTSAPQPAPPNPRAPSIE